MLKQSLSSTRLGIQHDIAKTTITLSFHSFHMNNQDLNTHIEKLIQMIEEQAALKADGNYSFVTSLITSAKGFQTEVLLTPEELTYSADAEQRQLLGEELGNFHQVLFGAYYYKHRSDKDRLNALTRRQNETHLQFYSRLLDELGTLPADFTTWFETDSGLTIASFEDSLDPWIALMEKEAGKKEIVQKIQKAIDLKALLIGSIRLYGLSDFDIRSTLANA